MKLKIKVKPSLDLRPTQLTIPEKNSAFTILDPPNKRECEIPEECLTVFVSRKVYKAIWEHARSDKNNEVGGALIGYYCRDNKENEKFLVITDVLNMPPIYFRNPTVLRFTTDFVIHLDAYMEQVNKKEPDLVRLGFYHTHPGYGVFLSGTDIRTFKGIFKDEWHIAMVVDPVNEDEGIFCWVKGKEKISIKAGFYVFKSGEEDFGFHKAKIPDKDMVECNRNVLELLPIDEKRHESDVEGGGAKEETAGKTKIMIENTQDKESAGKDARIKEEESENFEVHITDEPQKSGVEDDAIREHKEEISERETESVVEDTTDIRNFKKIDEIKEDKFGSEEEKKEKNSSEESSNLFNFITTVTEKSIVYFGGIIVKVISEVLSFLKNEPGREPEDNERLENGK